MAKHPGGRPTEYDSTVPQRAKEYLESCIDEDGEFHKTRGDKSDSFERTIKVNIPTIEGLAVHLGLTRETIYDWEGQEGKEEFSYILSQLRAEQAKRLVQKGLSGDYNPLIAKMMLTKHGYSDRQEVDITTKGEKVTNSEEIRELSEKFNDFIANHS